MSLGNFSISTLIAGFIFGVIGMYMIKRAKSEAHVPYFIIGLVLLIYPYFIENVFLVWGLGAGLVFLAFKM